MIGLTSSTNDRHRECWDLLPWLANERISASDLKRIQPHLRDCRACQEELETQRRLRDLVRGGDSVVIAPQASLQKLLNRIDAQEGRDVLESVPASSASAPKPARPRRAPRWLAIAASVQAILIGLLFGALWYQSQALMTAPRFSTLTAPSTVPRGPVIRVVFHEQVTIAELNEIVRGIDAHIVAGPNSAGVYTLQVEGERPSSEHVEQLAAQLRRDERILFSEPAFAELTTR